MKHILFAAVTLSACLLFAGTSRADAEVFVNKYGQTVEQQRWPHEPAGHEYTVGAPGKDLWDNILYQVYVPLDTRYSYRKVTVYAADGKTKSFAQVWDKMKDGSYKLREVIEYDADGKLIVKMWSLADDGKTPVRLYHYHKDGKALASLEELNKDGSVSRALYFKMHGIGSDTLPAVKVFAGTSGGVRKLDADKLDDKVKKGSLEPK